MEDHGLFDKLYQFIMVMVGGLVSFFFYRQRKINDQLDDLDKRTDKIEVNQAGYNKSVDYLAEKFTRLESKIDKYFDK